MSSVSQEPWTPAGDDQLRALWAEGLSTAKIGERVGRSKNAVVGRAHRIGLARPSPLKRRGPPRVPRAKPLAGAAKRVTLAPLANAAPVPAPATVAPIAVPRLGVVVALPVRRGACQFIAGEPAGARTLFCGAATVPGRSYCADHTARCFIPRTDRRTFWELA